MIKEIKILPRLTAYKIQKTENKAKTDKAQLFNYLKQELLSPTN